jgi:hypothetical protein
VSITTLATDALTVLGPITERYPSLCLTIDHLGGCSGSEPNKDAAARQITKPFAL